MNKIYIFGTETNDGITDSCIDLNKSKNIFQNVKGMNIARAQAACSVFKGRIVISGGCINGIFSNDKTNTVDAYDHVADKWLSMPNMIKLVLITNQLL